MVIWNNTAEYKTRHDWVGKVIHWELYKKLKFDHTNTWYMHNPESVLENEMHKLLSNFEIQMDHQISAWRPDLIVVKKKKKKKKEKKKKKKKLAELWILLSRQITEWMWKEGLVPRLC